MGSNHLNHLFSDENKIKKHLEYKENPLMFINEQWFGMSSENWQLQKITPFKYQESIIEEIHFLPKTFIASSRQMGITSLMCAYIAWYAIFNHDKTILIISPNLNGAQNILKNIKTILEHYKVNNIFDFDKDCLVNNKKELVLSNGCKIKARGASVDAGKGEAIHLLYVDQAAFMKNFEAIWMSIGMCLSALKDSKAIVASTPNDDSFFNKICLDIKSRYSDESEYSNKMPHLLQLTWDMHPKRDKAWYDNQCRMVNNNKVLIDQELNCIINYKDKSSNDKTISLRISSDLLRKIKLMIGDDSLSDYVRGLIEKDLGPT